MTDRDPPPHGPRAGVPLAVHDLDMKVRHEEALDAHWTAQTSPIKGADLGDNPLDIRGRKDVALLRSAIRQRWQIPEHVKEDVIDTMATILRTANSDRDRINAARLLLAADKLNLTEEQGVTGDGSPASMTVLITPEAAKGMTQAELDAKLAELDAAAGGGMAPG